MNPQPDLAAFPTIRELKSYDLSVLRDLIEGPCLKCDGAGIDCERPCKPCMDCEGRGKVNVPVFALGIASDIEAGIQGTHVTDSFKTLKELEAFCITHKDSILRHCAGD